MKDDIVITKIEPPSFTKEEFEFWASNLATGVSFWPVKKITLEEAKKLYE